MWYPQRQPRHPAGSRWQPCLKNPVTGEVWCFPTKAESDEFIKLVNVFWTTRESRPQRNYNYRSKESK